MDNNFFDRSTSPLTDNDNGFFQRNASSFPSFDEEKPRILVEIKEWRYMAGDSKSLMMAIISPRNKRPSLVFTDLYQIAVNETDTKTFLKFLENLQYLSPWLLKHISSLFPNEGSTGKYGWKRTTSHLKTAWEIFTEALSLYTQVSATQQSLTRDTRFLVLAKRVRPWRSFREKEYHSEMKDLFDLAANIQKKHPQRLIFPNAPARTCPECAWYKDNINDQEMIEKRTKFICEWISPILEEQRKQLVEMFYF